ncbi:hypothetical protein K4G98_25300, partial [Mycobacterium tuberculosis]|nr:hypothetical protein [Mycobacterium tuberculosis]
RVRNEKKLANRIGLTVILFAAVECTYFDSLIILSAKWFIYWDIGGYSFICCLCFICTSVYGLN